MDDTDEIVTRIGTLVAEQPVLFSYLFGSHARGDARGDSDIDVAVRFAPGLSAQDRFERALGLGVALERAIGREIDVVDLDEAPLRLAGRILHEHVVVTGQDRPERVRYETELFKRYVDFMQHVRDLDEQLLAAMAAEEPH